MNHRPNPNLYPEGGYFFVESDGSRWRGDSWKDLIAKVSAYRERNGRVVGEVEQDIFSQYCSRIPAHCRDMTNPPIQNAHSLSFNQRVLQRFSELLDQKRKAPKSLGRVSDAVAAERAAICARCPRQQPLVESCQTCINGVKHGRVALLDNAASLHQNLLPCGALSEDPQTTVHLDLPPVDSAALPTECWRRVK